MTTLASIVEELRRAPARLGLNDRQQRHLGEAIVHLLAVDERAELSTDTMATAGPPDQRPAVPPPLAACPQCGGTCAWVDRPTTATPW